MWGGDGFAAGGAGARGLSVGWEPGHLIAGATAYDAERPVADTQAQDVLMHGFSPSGAACGTC
ncbi:hypothetical protein [Amycolatopsis vastitatis]|uniref:Uncharacterized protein n=1 Tax=Amycolatopsis vastitatis TaxID=1905142 RepID=A0A229SQA6_9PSEU|nr:hypothetical protein [Amycolatopsis vastitatis]OXM60964.1 hypothetical protein CF165_39905 [Amycolatopsis vastitatis]